VAKLEASAKDSQFKSMLDDANQKQLKQLSSWKEFNQISNLYSIGTEMA
jgi:hypothetical protein